MTIKDIWDWFKFMFISMPFTAISAVLAFIILIIPVYAVVGLPVTWIGYLVGDNYSNFLAPIATLVVAWLFYTRTKRGEKFLAWVVKFLRIEF